MLSNFGWLLPGRLAGMGRPFAGAADSLRREGISAVLVLTEAPPLPEFEAAGLAVRHEPVVDFAPPRPAAMERCVAFVREHLAAGRAVVVHCAAGVGRTGTVLAACLVDGGAGAREAVARVRSARPGSVETPDQVAAVEAFARRRAEPGGAT